MCPDRERQSNQSDTTVDDLVRGNDFYALLEIEPSAETERINDRYRELAQEVHPDQSEASDARKLFRQIREAKRVLTDDDRRWLYDHLGHSGYYQLVSEDDSELSALVDIVEDKIDQQDEYTPPVVEMGPDDGDQPSEDPDGPDVVPQQSTGDIAQAVDDLLAEVSAVERTPDTAATTDATRDTRKTVDEQPGSLSEDHDSQATPAVAESQNDDDLATQTQGTDSPEPPSYTARTVTFLPADSAGVDPRWDYWQRTDAGAESGFRTVSMDVGLLWLIRLAVLTTVAAGSITVLGATGLGSYGVPFIILTAVGAASAMWLQRRVPPGTTAVSDPGLWRWPQSIGRILLVIGTVQVLLAHESVWSAFPAAVDGSITPGVWRPPAVDPIVTRIFLLVTVGSIAVGAFLVAVGLSWRLWIDRSAGGYDLNVVPIEAALTGSSGVAVMTPVQILTGSSTLGVLSLSMPVSVGGVLPETVFIHIGLIAAVGVALFPSAYTLLLPLVSRRVPHENMIDK